MRYAHRVRKISMFILFFVSFLENDENVLSELCSSFQSESSYVDIGILCRKCAHTPPRARRLLREATGTLRSPRTATAQPVFSAQSPGRLAAVTPGLTHSNGFSLRVSLPPSGGWSLLLDRVSTRFVQNLERHE